MKKQVPDYQIFVKPVGNACNLGCSYCYYAGVHAGESSDCRPISQQLLETYTAQHIKASPGSNVLFSWHGGEPTLAGLPFFRQALALQNKHNPAGKRIFNAIQTNGTLINEDWAQFLASANFTVGISIDGPNALHNQYRQTPGGHDSLSSVLRGLAHLQKHRVPTDILCVVNNTNVMYPLQVYEFLKDIGGSHISFLPLVEPLAIAPKASTVSERSVAPEFFGAFLCTIFDSWKSQDIGRVKIQIFEEALRTAFGQEHSLCLFRPVCGDIPILEKNGNLYACDHFVSPEYLLGNIGQTPLSDLLTGAALRQFGNNKRANLPRGCKECDVLDMCHGECPRNRFIPTGDGGPCRNYLCEGYKMFFSHCKPFAAAVAREWQQTTQAEQSQGQSSKTTGRNDPCPCGSGKKYKKCCLKAQ